MTTAQDQQSRAEFEAHMRKLSPCVRLYRHTCDGGDKYRTVTVQRNWELWQAARALPASMKPVAEIFAGDLFRVSQGPDAEPVTGDHDLYTAAQVLAMLAQDTAPMAGQCRFESDTEWKHCSSEHVRMVLATPQDWEGYEVRYLYAAAPQPPAAQADIGIPTSKENQQGCSAGGLHRPGPGA